MIAKSLLSVKCATMDLNKSHCYTTTTPDKSRVQNFRESEFEMYRVDKLKLYRKCRLNCVYCYL